MGRWSVGVLERWETPTLRLSTTPFSHSGLVFGRPNTRWPSFQRPCFLSTSTRSNRFMTLRFALMVLLPLRLRCWDMFELLDFGFGFGLELEVCTRAEVSFKLFY